MHVARWMVVSCLLAGTLLPGAAEAGRRSFTWVYDTEIVPQGDVDLEQWLWARGRVRSLANDRTRYWVWWGPVFGLSQQLELAVPFQVVSSPARTELDSFSADFRLRLQPRGHESPWQQLVRAAWIQSTRGSSQSRLELNLVQSYQWDNGLRAVLDLGAQASHPVLRGLDGPLVLRGTWAAGLSYPLVEDELRLAFELFGEVPVSGLAEGIHQFAGVDLAWTFGRMWLTAGVLVGVTPLFPETPSFMPRLIWAVLL